MKNPNIEDLPDEDYEEVIIFRKYYVHPVTGERVYPKNGKVFPIKIRRPKQQ